MTKDEKAEIYWNVQMDTLRMLHRIGIEYGLQDRIPPMVVMKNLRKLKDKYPEYYLLDAVAALMRLVLYRTQGYEPAIDPTTPGNYVK